MTPPFGTFGLSSVAGRRRLPDEANPAHEPVYARLYDTGRRLPVEPPDPAPCPACPWLVENWSKTEGPYASYYKPEVRAEHWDQHKQLRTGTGIRRGAQPSCHLHSPPDAMGNNAKATGVRLCASAVALVHRELLIFHSLSCNLAYYNAAPRSHEPLTVEGIYLAVRRLGLEDREFALMPRDQLLEHLHPWAENEAIGW